MRFYPLDRDFEGSWVFNKTLTGQPIISGAIDDCAEGEEEYDESYPLRFHLDRIQSQVLTFLTEQFRRATECDKALKIIREKAWNTWEKLDATTKYTNQVFSISSFLYKGSQRLWAIWHELSDPIDQAPDDWLEDTNYWEVEKAWSWAEIYALAALWAVDEATYLLNKGEHYKAAAWTISAQELMRTLRRPQSQKDVAKSISTIFSKLGSDAAHAENRALKKKGLEIYYSKCWKSKAEAARRIAPEVKRTEQVVLRWIREDNGSLQGR